MVLCKKLVISEFGNPPDVVKPFEEELSLPKEDEVLIEMLLASMNPADMVTIRGTYALKPELPAVPGAEGVGRVAVIGKAVIGLAVGDLVIANIELFGTWRSHAVVKSTNVLKIPHDVPLVEVAGIASNTSTAYRMLKDFVNLKPGDSVIQNGANSAAGQNVIQLCKAWGIQSINIVRDRPNIADLKKQLTDLGATHVLTEEELRSTDIISSNIVAAPKLALNCVGGESASELMKCLAQRGVIVTYGGMSLQPVIIPTPLFIYKDITAKGHWMTRWTRENKQSDARKLMLSELMDLMKGGKLKAPQHKLIPFEQYMEALESTAKGMAGVKYILDFRK